MDGCFFIFAQNFKIKKIFEIFKNPPSLASNINTPTILLCKVSLYTVYGLQKLESLVISLTGRGHLRNLNLV